jgi:hypothetical protein
MNTQFADIIGNISLSAGVVRIDLLQAKASTKNTESTELEKVGQLFIPIEGFLKSLEIQESMKQQMIERGILKPSKDE